MTSQTLRCSQCSGLATLAKTTSTNTSIVPRCFGTDERFIVLDFWVCPKRRKLSENAVSYRPTWPLKERKAEHSWCLHEDWKLQLQNWAPHAVLLNLVLQSDSTVVSLMEWRDKYGRRIKLPSQYFQRPNVPRAELCES